MFSNRFDQIPRRSSSTKKSSKTQTSFSSKTHRVVKHSASFNKDKKASFSQQLRNHYNHLHQSPRPSTSSTSNTLVNSPAPTVPENSQVITFIVGPQRRVFAAHEDALAASSALRRLARTATADSRNAPQVFLVEEIPEVFSSVLEYLYKGDYYPRLVRNNRRNSWELESAEASGPVSPVYVSDVYGYNCDLLKDTLVYCAAERYGLAELKKMALKKQGLQTNVSCSSLLASARYAYANTPDTDSKLRAHYLALIIRSRSTFKNSGTMQTEMFNGGTVLFFDLFVAMCNHIDDIAVNPAHQPTRDYF